ncbi:helix-turn-helix domain-containing protein [Runella zeae]|uniref:helix-turn-helix domain-containing protein n=1 Tax=Runella zeae TaxID=94255 RepID=UPI00042A2B55|nr:helix-turn-helix transcriptional regulator [Runella zeae]
MNTPTQDHTKVNYAERLESIRGELGVSRNQLVDIIKISLSTINRIEIYNHEPSPYFFSQLRKNLPEAVSYMSGESDVLPELHTPVKAEKKSIHEGEQLKNYLRSHKISYRELGRLMGIAQTSVSYYVQTVNFQAGVKEKIAKALGVSEEAVFGVKTILKPSNQPEMDLFSVPIVQVSDRRKLSKEYLDNLLNSVGIEDIYSKNYFYVRRNKLSNEEVNRALVLEIASSDNMQPVLLPGALVLGLLVPPSEYGMLDRFVVIGTIGRVLVRRVVSNRLRTDDMLEVVSVDNNFSGSLTIKREDIDFVIELISIVDQPLR